MRGPAVAALVLLAACGDGTGPRAAPSGARLVLALLRDGNRDIYTVRPDGTDLVRLTADAADDARPTAAGGTVVFVSARDGRAELYSVPLSGGVARRLTDTAGDEQDPALSPDGSRLAYTLPDAGGSPRVMVASATGLAARPLMAAAADAAAADAGPAWRPDGEALAWATSASGSADIVAATLNAAAASTLVGGPAAEVEPSWSPDGGRIAFVSTRDGDQAVFVADVATRAVTRLSPVGLAASSPTWLSPSEIAYVARDAAGTTLLRQPIGGTPAVIPLPSGAVPSHPRAVIAP